MYEQLPETLKKDAGFLLWRYETRKVKKTKVPYTVKRFKANPTDRKQLSSFEVVKFAMGKGGYDGIGIFVEPRFSAIDIDDCVKYGKFTALAADIIALMDSYTEYSPSGKGIRILINTTDAVFDKEKYYVNNRKLHLEVYTEKKYVTVTGNAVCEKPIRKCGEDFTAFFGTLYGKAYAEKAGNNSAGKFSLGCCSY